MRSTPTLGTGRISDRVHAVAIQLRGLEDLRQVEYRWGRIVRSLEDLAACVARVRRRGGRPPGLDAAVGWLEAVIRHHPALAGPGGEELREELARMIDRLRGAR